MDLGNLLSGPIGAITGAVGIIGSKIMDYKIEQAKGEHELAMRDKDYALAKMELEAKSEIAKVDADTQVQMKEYDALASSIAADRASYGDSLLGRIVDLVRGLTRPVITYVAMILVTYDTIVAMKGTSMALADRVGIVNTGLFLAGVAITWWFGSRPNRKG